MDNVNSAEFMQQFKAMEKKHPEFMKELGHTIYDLIERGAFEDINPLTYVVITSFQNALVAIAAEQAEAAQNPQCDA
jgi:hypothetical protein